MILVWLSLVTAMCLDNDLLLGNHFCPDGLCALLCKITLLQELPVLGKLDKLDAWSVAKSPPLHYQCFTTKASSIKCF